MKRHHFIANFAEKVFTRWRFAPCILEHVFMAQYKAKCKRVNQIQCILRVEQEP
jgi:hypothetical protein